MAFSAYLELEFFLYFPSYRWAQLTGGSAYLLGKPERRSGVSFTERCKYSQLQPLILFEPLKACLFADGVIEQR